MIFTKELLKGIFELLEHTKGVKQGEKNHPEGDVYTHSLQCVSWAFKETLDIDLILAALCHDFGKAIETIGHEKHSINLCNEYLSGKSLWLISHHLRIRDLFDGKMKRIRKVNYLLTHPWLPELIHLSRFDKLGRDPNIKRLYTNDEIIGGLNMVVDNHFMVNTSYKLRYGESRINDGI